MVNPPLYPPWVTLLLPSGTPLGYLPLPSGTPLGYPLSDINALSGNSAPSDINAPSVINAPSDINALLHLGYPPGYLLYTWDAHRVILFLTLIAQGNPPSDINSPG